MKSEFLGAIGAMTITYGLWMITPPLAMVFAGGLLLFLAWVYEVTKHDS